MGRIDSVVGWLVFEALDHGGVSGFGLGRSDVEMSLCCGFLEEVERRVGDRRLSVVDQPVLFYLTYIFYFYMLKNFFRIKK